MYIEAVPNRGSPPRHLRQHIHWLRSSPLRFTRLSDADATRNGFRQRCPPAEQSRTARKGRLGRVLRAHRWIDPEHEPVSQVRTGLSAGGSWIRTIGPAVIGTAVRGAPVSARAAVLARSGPSSVAAFASDPNGGSNPFDIGRPSRHRSARIAAKGKYNCSPTSGVANSAPPGQPIAPLRYQSLEPLRLSGPLD
jgi:hypothetical protein